MRTAYRVEITRTAERDIEAIRDYIARDHPERADRFILDLEERIETLERFPKHCPRIPEGTPPDAPYRHLIHGEYRTIFRIAGTTMYILRVTHGARLLELPASAS